MKILQIALGLIVAAFIGCGITQMLDRPLVSVATYHEDIKAAYERGRHEAETILGCIKGDDGEIHFAAAGDGHLFGDEFVRAKSRDDLDRFYCGGKDNL